MSNDASTALAAITSSLYDKLKGSGIDLFTSHGVQNFNFGLAAPGLAQAILSFWQANGRAPNVLLNDGMPASMKAQLLASPQPQKLVTWRTFSKGYNPPLSATLSLLSFDHVENFAAPVFACKVLTKPTAVFSHTEVQQDNENSNVVQVDTPIGNRALNDRFMAGNGTIPLDQIQFGAFQNWGLFLVAYSHPEFLFSTDDGVMLTTDGIDYLERSLAYWSNTYSPWQGGFATFSGLTQDSGSGTAARFAAEPWSALIQGPYIVGVPLTILDGLKRLRDQYAAAGSTAAFFTYLLTIAISFYGFYFGASGASGLISGAFTLPNFSASLSLASRFGMKLNPAIGLGLKILNGTISPDDVPAVDNPIDSAIPDLSMDEDPELWNDALDSLEAWNIAYNDFSLTAETAIEAGADAETLNAVVSDSADTNLSTLDQGAPVIDAGAVADNTPIMIDVSGEDDTFIAPGATGPMDVGVTQDALSSVVSDDVLSNTDDESTAVLESIPVSDDSTLADVADTAGILSLDQFTTILHVDDATAAAASDIFNAAVDGGDSSSIDTTVDQAAAATDAANSLLDSGGDSAVSSSGSLIDAGTLSTASSVLAAYTAYVHHTSNVTVTTTNGSTANSSVDDSGLGPGAGGGGGGTGSTTLHTDGSVSVTQGNGTTVTVTPTGTVTQTLPGTQPGSQPSDDRLLMFGGIALMLLAISR